MRVKPDKNHRQPKGISDYIEITDTLDLHGFFPEQAGEMVEVFIQNALELGLTRLRIIHGKGRSRLKYEVHQILKAYPRVRDFYDSPVYSGGWGATDIELRSEKK
jgi:DNA-nicking Smr family endonuclease